MIINIGKQMKANTMLSKIVLHCITYHANKEVKDSIIKDSHSNDSEIDVNLSINGHEMDLFSFIERWQDSVDREVEKGIVERLTSSINEDISEQFSNVRDFLNNLEDSIEDEIKKRVESEVGIENGND